MIKKYLILLLALFLTQTAFSQEEIDEGLLNYEKESWNLGISRFTGINLEKQNEYLISALPLLLLDELSDIDMHLVSEAEKVAYKGQYISDRIISLRKEKSSLHNQRDGLLFSQTERKERQAKYKEISENIDRKDSLINLWLEVGEEEIRMDSEIPLKIQKYTDESSRLTDNWSQTSDFMKQKGLDQLITGSVEKLDDLFFLNIRCYELKSNEPVVDFQKTGSEDELNSLLKEASDALRTAVLGRSWAGLNIKASPDNALILIDGETKGVGNFHSKILSPGFITCTVKSSGFKTYSSQIYLAPDRSEYREITLDQGSTEELFIYSDPPGADVYFGALWMGQTPLTTHKPYDTEKLKVSKENFMPFILSSDELNSDSITIQLDPGLYSKKTRLQESKSAFYRSLGWFSLSIGIPLVLSGIYQNLDNRYYKYAVDYNSTGDSNSYDKALYYKKYADITYYSFWGGVAVSGTLFINTLFKLRNYILAAEESTEE